MKLGGVRRQGCEYDQNILFEILLGKGSKYDQNAWNLQKLINFKKKL